MSELFSFLEPSAPEPQKVPYVAQTGNELFGYQEIQRQIEENFRDQKLHHGILFSGPQGIGKASFAKFLAQNLIASSLHNSCYSQSEWEANIGANLLLITRELNQKQELRKDITVDVIRKIKDFTALTSASAKYRVIIIDSVDELNKNAANALLKLLEEPPADVFLFLINHSPARLPVTIRSRCALVKIQLKMEDFSRALRKLRPDISAEQISALFNICDSSIALALDIYDQAGFDFYQRLIKFAVKQGPAPLDAVNKDNFWPIFEHLCQFYLTQLAKKIVGGQINYLSHSEQEYLQQYSYRKSTERFFAICDQIREIFASTNNLNLEKKHSAGNIFNLIANLN